MATSDEKVGCLFAIFRLLGITPGKVGGFAGQNLPYRRRDDFLSPAEQAFFGVLAQVVPADVVICPKVRVADLLFVGQGSNYQSHMNRIDRKHVDFVLCRREGFRPLVVVELDDASHQRADRMERDRFLDQAFQAAGLPLLHVPAQRMYSVEELRGLIHPHLGAAAPSLQEQPPVITTAGTPICPKCRIPMVLRTSSRGRNQGGQFYGCKNYPQCREIVPIP
jgi:hypothetical protein